MLTIESALELNSFQNARVVAGESGLKRVITWVHNVGVPDAAQWLNGGELAMTTAINLPVDDDQRRAYVEALIQKRVAGLVVTVGQTLDHLPACMLQVADHHDFPLIEVPYTARYVDMARDANEHIAQENMAMVTRALNIQQTLTRLVLEGGGVKQLASALAELVNQSISIENERFEALASINIGAVDEARRYTQQYGHTDPRLVAALEAEVLPEIRRTLRPVHIPSMPHVGLEMERILAPIVVHGEIYGFMWLIADKHPLTELERMAIEGGATIAALMMLYQESIQSAEASLKGSLLTRLVQGEMSGRNILTDQAFRYGVDLRQSYRALLVDFPNVQSQRLLGLYRRVNRIIELEEFAALTGQFAGQVLVIAQETPDIGRLVERIHQQAHEDETMRIGLSAVTNHARNVKNAYIQCREVLRITRKLGRMHEKTVWFERLGYLHALYHAGPDALNDNPYTPALKALAAENSADLFHTLETYLDLGGNGVSTAHTLSIHRSTLNYRLDRISEVCSAAVDDTRLIDLSDPHVRMNLQVALKLLRMFETD
jgi:PucR family transcriptional regulator, purine catabolism regulatory protein